MIQSKETYSKLFSVSDLPGLCTYVHSHRYTCTSHLSDEAYIGCVGIRSTAAAGCQHRKR